jgi:hypothetical protein
MEKIKIEPGTVQETLLIPLYGRKQAMDRYPDIFMDHDCQEIFSHVDFQVSDQMSGKIGKIGSIMGATRQFDMASVCRTYLKDHPKACVVNLGCGLDTTFRQVDNGHARAYNLDFPDAIAARNELLGDRERDVLFIDASKLFEKEKKQNVMKEEHIDHVLELYNNRKTVEKEAYLASYDDIVANDFNLNIPRYVDTTEEEEEIDLKALTQSMRETDKQIKEENAALVGMMKELTFQDDATKEAVEAFIRVLEEV